MSATVAKSIEITVFDCETKEPVGDVQIFTETQRFLGTTDQNGKARLTNLGIEKINFKKLGYEPLLLPSDELNEICLFKKSEELSEVFIQSKLSNFYDTLISLRNKNKAAFLDYEAIITYSFTYKTSSIDEMSTFDEGKGYFTVRYQKDYAYPNLFSNSNDYAKVIDFQYQSNNSLSSKTFDSIKYLDPSTLISCYDVMEKKFNNMDWWNFNNTEVAKSTKYFQEPDHSRTFVTYNRLGQVSRKFYFDSQDVIQKVEVLRPTYFYKSNYREDDAKFFVRVSYSKTLPRVANHYLHTYEVHTPALSYKTSLTIAQVYPQKQTLLIPDENKRNTVFSLIGSFHDLTQEIKEAKLRNKVRN